MPKLLALSKDTFRWYHAVMSDLNPEEIDLSKLRPRPFRHDSLSPKLLEQIRAIHQHIGRYIGMNQEEFEIGFMRDLVPDVEVALWTHITVAWHAYHRRHLIGRRQSDELETKMVAALLAISSGVEDVESIGLPAEVGNRLLECYAHPIDE